MNEHSEKILRSVKPNRIIFPILIGLAVVFFLVFKEFDINTFSILKFTSHALLFLTIALILMVLRDIGYMIRLRILSDNQISWRGSFWVIMLWEFTSAISPSAVGGTSVATLYVHKENISIGKSAAIVLATSFLDELFFIIVFPLILLLVSPTVLFTLNHGNLNESLVSYAHELMLFAYIGYGLKLVWVIALSYGLLINPKGFKWLLMFIFRLPYLRKWRYEAMNVGTDIVNTSVEFRSKDTVFWLKAIGATFLSWISRFWVANALLFAFFATTDQFTIFARQLTMWIMMLISPTPGGSGVSEYIFTRYLAEFIPVDTVHLAGIAITLAVLWRLYTYYPYLFIGAFLFPIWIRKKFGKKP